MDGQLVLRRLALIFGAMSLIMMIWFIVAMPTTLAVAVGPPGSIQASLVESIRRAMKDTRQPFRIRLVHVSGSVEASRALDAGKVDLAIARSDDPTSTEARSIVVVHKRAIVVVAPKDAGITSFTDLRGRKTGIVRGETDSNVAIIERLMEHYDFSPEDIQLEELSSDTVGEALGSGKIDAFVLLANPTAAVARRILSEIAGVRKIPVVIHGLPAAEALARRFRELHTYKIPEGIYGGTPPRPDADIETVGISYELVASNRLSEIRGASLTKSLMELRTRLRRDLQSSLFIETPPVEEQRRFLPHAGAAAVVKDEAKTLLETYSDELWLALFAFSLLGSSVTGFFSWAGLQKAASDTSVSTRMRQIAGNLERASCVDDIDSVQGDFDDLVLTIMRDYGLKRISLDGEPDPAAWIGTFGGLIERRRTLLTGTDPATQPNVLG